MTKVSIQLAVFPAVIVTLYQDLASTFKERSAIIAVNKGPNLYFVKLYLIFLSQLEIMIYTLFLDNVL